ncbi:MAG: Uma2 family endonuclease [Myxococcales bacterium]|nr:Uma2 family endonuclease [Myxococcales bacterium]
MPASLGPKPPPRGEDLPYDDGEPMETKRHRQQMNLLVDSLADHWRGRDDVCVEGNMAVYFSETQARNNDFRAPDVFVVLDTVKKERKSWVVWEEEGRTPDLVIELTSPSTEAVDRGKKKHVYARLLRVPMYVIYDPFSAALEGWALGSHGSYELVALDADGRLPCPQLGLSLGVRTGTFQETEAPWLRWFADGRVVPHSSELVGGAQAERAVALQHAEAAELRARDAERRLREVERRAEEAEQRAREAEERVAEAARSRD